VRLPSDQEWAKSEHCVGDVLLYSSNELETIADEKGRSLPLLDAKWQQRYKTASPRGLFTKEEMRVA